MEKNIEYYMGLPYTRELIPEPEGGWFVRIKELPGCMSQGDTTEEAMDMIEEAMRGWLEIAIRDGIAITEPRSEEEYSGKFVVRVPKSLHRKLSEFAVDDDVSLNSWINSALAEAVGIAIPNKDESNTGLSAAMREVITSVSIGSKVESVDEYRFACWLEGNLRNIKIDLRENNIRQAQKNAADLSSLLGKQRHISPLLDCLCKIFDDFSNLLGLNADMAEKVADPAIILRVGDIVRSNYKLKTQSENQFSTPDLMDESESQTTLNFSTDWSNPYDEYRK